MRTINREPKLNLRSRLLAWKSDCLPCLLPHSANLLARRLGGLLVYLHRLKIPPMDEGKVLPEKILHLHMRQIRQVKMIPHFGTKKFRDYSMAWILQVPNRGASLTRELKGSLFVPYLTNPETIEHRSTLYCQGPKRV
ncbi:hypothetical protein COP1_023056 [Malus domestica]